MKLAALTGPGAVTLVDRPEPVATGDLVKVRVLVAPMCTEFKDRRVGTRTENLGHEAAGVVVDAASSHLVKAGDRVVVMPGYGCGVCRLCTSGEHIFCPFQRDLRAETGSTTGGATYAEFLLKPDWLLVPVPDDLDLRHAALACCGLGPGFTAALRTRMGSFDHAIVSGGGPVGLGALINATARGADVDVWEPSAYRAQLAKTLGATVVLDPSTTDGATQARERTAGWGADAAVETSGARTAPEQLLRSLRPLGRLAVVAWGAALSLPPLVPTGVEIHGCWHWNHQRHASEMWKLIRHAGSRLDTLITHEFDLDQVSAAMDVQDSAECGKVLLLPHGAEALS